MSVSGSLVEWTTMMLSLDMVTDFHRKRKEWHLRTLGSPLPFSLRGAMSLALRWVEKDLCPSLEFSFPFTFNHSSSNTHILVIEPSTFIGWRMTTVKLNALKEWPRREKRSNEQHSDESNPHRTMAFRKIRQFRVTLPFEMSEEVCFSWWMINSARAEKGTSRITCRLAPS